MSSIIHLLYHITHAFASVFANFFAGIAQLVEQRIRNAQVVGSSPIPSSRTNRFVKPFGKHGGFSFSRDGLFGCAISAPFQKSALKLF